MLRIAIASVFMYSACAHAATTSATVNISNTNFDGGMGERRIASVETATAFDKGALVLQAARGDRNYGSGSQYHGTSFGGTLYYDWNDLISTRTLISGSSNDPVFAKSIIDQDFTFKVIPRTTLTAGIRHAEYVDGVDLDAWNVAVAHYMPRVTVRYRHTRHQLSGSGSGYGNLLMTKLKDGSGDGYTQLWLGQGTVLQEFDWSPTALPGDYRSIVIRRIQPIGKNWMLSFSAGRSWHDTAALDYAGTTAGVGLTYRGK